MLSADDVVLNATLLGPKVLCGLQNSPAAALVYVRADQGRCCLGWAQVLRAERRAGRAVGGMRPGWNLSLSLRWLSLSGDLIPCDLSFRRCKWTKRSRTWKSSSSRCQQRTRPSLKKWRYELRGRGRDTVLSHVGLAVFSLRFGR